MLKKKRLLSCIICFVMVLVGIPFSAQATSSNKIVAQNEAIFQKADPNEISATVSSPTTETQRNGL